MPEYKYTAYFENEVLRKRPYIKKEWCIKVIENPLKVERQEHNRFRFWGKIEELGGRILRVVTVDDKKPSIMHSQIGDSNYEIKLLSRN
jgi:hypothetical protein